MNWIKKNCDLIIVGILTIVSMIGLYRKYDYGVSIEVRNYLAYFVIVSLVIFRLLKFKKGKTVLGIALLIGTFNLIQFTHSSFTFSFSLGGLTVLKFQPVSFFALIGLIVMDIDGTRKFLRFLFPEKSEEIVIEENTVLIESFKDKYESYPKGKLQEIIDNPESYQKSAVEAARQLIEG